MQVKILEIRDKGTMIPVLCVNMNVDPEHIDLMAEKPADRVNERRERAAAQFWHLRRSGYPCDGRPNIGITHLAADGHDFCNDPYGWKGGDRTWPTAHNYIIDNWDKLKDGDVVCVEHILGERPEPKVSERFDAGA